MVMNGDQARMAAATDDTNEVVGPGGGPMDVDATEHAETSRENVAGGAGSVVVPEKAASAEEPKGKLADRLKVRGLELSAGPSDNVSVPLTAASLAALPATGSHSPLTVSSIEQKQIFTPLGQQGARALEEQKKRKEEGEQELLQSVRVTLKKWVQECLSSEEKQQKLREKGVLKCRVKARWSEGLDRKLKDLVASYGGKLAADGEKEGTARAPAWATAAELRTEKWMVGFDAPAFEKFMKAHPETVDPPDPKVKEFVKEFISKADLQTMRVKDLLEALQTKFGHLRRPLLNRAKGMASDEITILQERLSKIPAKKKEDQQGDPGSIAILKAIGKSGAGKGVGKKKMGNKEVVAISRPEDVFWAEATLAPLGMRPDSDEPMVRSPAPVAVPILEGLKAFQDIPQFRDLLRTTKIGKVVNAFRHHPNSEVAKAAKELVNGWKAALTSVAGQKKPHEQRRVKEEAGGGPKEEGGSGDGVAASASSGATAAGDVAMETGAAGAAVEAPAAERTAIEGEGETMSGGESGGAAVAEEGGTATSNGGAAENGVLDVTMERARSAEASAISADAAATGGTDDAVPGANDAAAPGETAAEASRVTQ